MNSHWPYYPYYGPPYKQTYYQPNAIEPIPPNWDNKNNNDEHSTLEKEENSHPFPSIEHFYSQLQDLQEKLEALQEENEQLKDKIEKIRPIQIENINYKIQELKVEELSGTLNIGMTALTDPENIQELMNKHENITLNDVDTEEYGEAMNDVENNKEE